MVANAITQFEDNPRALLIAPSEFELMWRIARVAHESKMSGLQSAEQAMFIMLKGYEIGIKPMQALSGMHSIQGKPTMSPQLMLAMVRKSGQLEAIEIPDAGTIKDSCTVIIKRRGEKEHRETYTMEQARQMGLVGKDNWKKQPGVMLRWRTVSAALRMVFPDIIEGLYMPEEIDPDTDVDENGAVIGTTPANVVTLPRQDAPKPPILEAYNTAPVDGTGALIPDVVEQDEPPVIRGNGTNPTRLNEPVDWRKPVVFFKRVADMGLPTEGIVSRIEPGKNTPAEITLEWDEVHSRLLTIKEEREQGATPPAQPSNRTAYNWFTVWQTAQEEDLDFGDKKHFDRWLAKCRTNGTVTDKTTTEELIALARKYESRDTRRARNTADNETNKPWYAAAMEAEPHKTHTATFHSIKYLRENERWIFIGGKDNEREISEFGDAFWTLANTLPKEWVIFLEGIQKDGLDFVRPLPCELEIEWTGNRAGYPAAKSLTPNDGSNVKF